MWVDGCILNTAPTHDSSLSASEFFFNHAGIRYFVEDLNKNMLECSRNQLPYPKLGYFAQGPLSTRRWVDLLHLVDGMDLTEWGYENLYWASLTKNRRNT
jgi:hypothetical protein